MLSTQSVVYGAGAKAPAAPARKGYTFKGWSTSYTNITKNTVVTATYSPIYVSKVTVSGSTKHLAAGKKVTLKASVAPSNALNTAVT